MVFEIDGKMYLNPLLHLQLTENPFKLEERKYPVDFTVRKKVIYSLKITLPENYIIEELPQPIRMGLPEKSALILYNVGVVGNTITIMYKLVINKEVFYTDEYKLLKEFYSQIIEKHAEPIIISKK